MRALNSVWQRAVALSMVVAIGMASMGLATVAGQDKERAGTTGRSRSAPRAARVETTNLDRWTRGPRGFATYYAKTLDGLETASGTRFDNDDMVAAHPTYPFGTLVRVTNLANGRMVVVRIVDRGPAQSSRARGNIIDLSRAAAQKLGFISAGRARVRLEFRRPDLPQRPEGAPPADAPDPDDDDVVTSAGGRRTAAEKDR